MAWPTRGTTTRGQRTMVSFSGTSSSTSTLSAPKKPGVAPATNVCLIAVWPSSLDKEQETVELTGKNYTRNDWRKMLSTRRGTVFVAGVCAAVAALILVVAMNGYRQSVNTAGNPATVLVAGSLIQKGTSGDAVAAGQLFKPTTVASKQVTSGAFADSAQL